MIRRIAYGLAIVVAIAVAVLWLSGRTIAESALANELAKRGVLARYRVAQIGFGWQRLEQVSIGDPARPDLTADWAEVHLVADWNGVHADAVRARGVRLSGRFADGRMSWGALDRLIPKVSGGPFALPDIDVTLDDGRVALATPWGAVGAKIDGRGGLRDGFAGKLALVMPTLVISGCSAKAVTAYVDLKMREGAPGVTGPVRMARADCAGTSLGASSIAVDASLSTTLDAWRGHATLDLRGLTNRDTRAAQVTGVVGFDGSAAATTGQLAVASPSLRTGSHRLDGVTIKGRYAVHGTMLESQGAVHVAQAVPGAGMIAQMPMLLDRARGTPLAPLAAQIGTALTAAARGGAIDANYAVKGDGGQTSVLVDTLEVRSASGALLTVKGGQGMRLGTAGLFADTHATLTGGGFPKIDADIRRTPDGESRGLVHLAPLGAGDTRLAMGPVRFRALPNGYVRIATVAALDGAFDSGRVDGLTMPLVAARLADGRIVVNPGCGPVAFSRFTLENVVLTPARLEVCASDRGLTDELSVALPVLHGRIGSTPLDARAGSARINMGTGYFALAKIAVRLGSDARVTRIEGAKLDGTMRGGALAGQFAGVSGAIGKVPLLVDGGAGSWQLNKGVFDLRGTATVSDDNPAPRFNPLTADVLTLRLAHNQIIAKAILRQPGTGTAIATVDITHALGKGDGHATLDVADLRFGNSLQPEALTRLTLGVIANVKGAVSGRGEIDWTADGVTSTGRFSTDRLDFAAAFGPVDGARGTIAFTDLIGLVTAPGQVAVIDSINPGVPVLGGRVTYRLLAGQRIMVEGGRWPFAGGALVLEPTVLDMSEAQERRLTFTVQGLDAAQFIQTLQFENLAATGLFDGTIPMIFDAQGGRIEGGEIVARDGGTLSYVGDVSNAKLNSVAKMAFDALKSIRYRNLSVGLNGPLDGEMVSTINFRGVNQNPASKPTGYIARQLAGLPFKFNIVIRAPFRQLLSTAQTFQDPSILLRRIPGLPPAIQPAESEKRP